MAIISVLDFGADNTGKAESTKAIQSAVDCAKKGDTVFLPNGTYISGTVKLKSDITFQLDKYAILYGICDDGKYEQIPFDENNNYCKAGEGPYGTFPNFVFVLLSGVENVTVTGGNIMFDDRYFDVVYANAPTIIDEDYVAGVEYFRQPSTICVPRGPFRPFGLYVLNSKNITVKDIGIISSPVYSAWNLNSSNILYDGVKIRNNKYQWNGDGLHFSACHDVEIKNCDISASDDCVAIDGNYGGQSYNYDIHDNILYSTIHCIRLYTGLDLSMEESCDGDYQKYSVHDIKIRNNKIIDSVTALLVCAFDGDVYNVEINNLSGDLNFEGTTLSLNAKAGRIHDFIISDSNYNCNGVGMFTALNNGKIDSISLENCNFSVTPKTKFWGDEYSDVATHGYSMPYNFLFRNVTSATLKNVSIKWNKPLFTDTMSEEDGKAILNKVGEKRLKEIEPNEIKAINNVNSNIKIIDCKINDYRRK